MTAASIQVQVQVLPPFDESRVREGGRALALLERVAAERVTLAQRLADPDLREREHDLSRIQGLRALFEDLVTASLVADVPRPRTIIRAQAAEVARSQGALFVRETDAGVHDDMAGRVGVTTFRTIARVVAHQLSEDIADALEPATADDRTRVRSLLREVG